MLPSREPTTSIGETHQNNQNKWGELYSEDTIQACRLAIGNPNYLGWLKILTGPSFKTPELTHFQEIIEKKCELHLNLVMFNITTQLINANHEKQVFKLIRNKAKAENNLPHLSEVKKVEKFYLSIRNDHLNNRENEFWFSIDESKIFEITETPNHANFYKKLVNSKDQATNSQDLIVRSYRDLFNQYTDDTGLSCNQPYQILTKSLLATANRYFEIDQEKLFVETYKRWKNKATPEEWDRYNSTIGQYFMIIFNKLKMQIFSKLNASEVELVNLKKQYYEQVTSTNIALASLIIYPETEIEKYTMHVKTWMLTNKDILPEKYRNQKPELLSQKIISTGVHHKGLGKISESYIENNWFQNTTKNYNIKENSSFIINCKKVISLLIQQGCDPTQLTLGLNEINFKDKLFELAQFVKDKSNHLETSCLAHILKSMESPAYSKILEPVTSGIDFYSHHYQRYLCNINPNNLDEKYQNLYLACIGLVDAAISGNDDAQSKLVSNPMQLMGFNMPMLIQNEYIARLKQLLEVHENKNPIYKRLAIMGLKGLDAQFYSSYEERFVELLQAILHSYLMKSDTVSLATEEHYRNLALHVLLQELACANQESIESSPEKPFTYPHRLISRQIYANLVTSKLIKNAEDSTLASQYLQAYDSFVAKHIKSILCHKQSNGQYHLELNAAEIDSNSQTITIFIDKDADLEIARFQRLDTRIEFICHEHVKLKVNGNLEGTHYLFRNISKSTIDLYADFSAKNLQLYIDANCLNYFGNTDIAHNLNIESNGLVCIAKSSKLHTENLFIKADSLKCNGEINIQSVTFLIDQTIEILPDAAIKASNDINIKANSLREMRGQIIAVGNIRAIFNDSAYLHGNGLLKSKKNIALSANSLMCSDQAETQAENTLFLNLNQTAIFSIKTKITSAHFEITALQIKNYSSNLRFETADFNAKDCLTNYSSGIIKTTKLLKLRGESVWSSGNIDYGKQLHVTLNKIFVLGFAESNEFYRYAKNNRSTIPRPCIQGGNATIVSAVFLNVFSGVWTKNLSVTALADIDLIGMTAASNNIRSRILAVDAGISVPNLPAIIQDLGAFLGLCGKHEFTSAITGLLTQSALFRATTFAKLLVRTLFPALGKPLDFIWGSASFVSALPSLYAQIKKLYERQDNVQLHEIISLLGTVNSLTIQAVILESQFEPLMDGIDHIEFQKPNVQAICLDVLGLALPSNSSNTLINFSMGEQAAFSLQQRDFISLSRFNTWMALNASHSFYYLNEGNTNVVANNYSLTGYEAQSSGSVYAENYFTNISHFTSNNNINVDKAFYQVEKLKLLLGSHIHARDLQGFTKTAETDGEISVKHGVLTASEAVTNNGKIEAISNGNGVPNDDKTPPALILQSHHVNNNGEIIAKDQIVALVSDEKVEQAGHVEADTLVEQAKVIANSGIADVHKMLIQGEQKEDFSGKIHLHATDKPGELYVDTPLVNSTPDSEVNGNGLCYFKTPDGLTLGHIDVPQLAIETKDIPDELDLIAGRGRYINVHVTEAMSLESKNNLIVNQNIDVRIALSIKANALNFLNNFHSTKSLQFESTGYGIDIKRASVTSDETLFFKSKTYFNNDHGCEYGKELYILANTDILNQAGTWAASKYLFVKSELGSIIISCDETDIKGKYDILKVYKSAYVFGGTGEGHDGVGLVMAAAKKLIIDGSVINTPGSNIFCGDEGIEILARHHSYESYYRHSKTWYGKSSTTIEYDNQIQVSSIISQGGSNTFSSKSGYIYSCSGQFLSGRDANFYAKKSITALGLQLQKECYKDTSQLWGVIDHSMRQRDEENVPTYVVSLENARFISLEEDVNLYDVYVRNGGTADIFGRNVTILDPVLKHSYEVESRGFGIESPLLNTPNELTQLYNDYQALNNSQNLFAQAQSGWNLGVDAVNTLNGTINGARNLHSYLSPEAFAAAQLSYTHSKTSVHYQTLATNVGFYVKDLNITATNKLDIEGAPIEVTNDAVINAKHFIEQGVELESSVDSTSQTISASVSPQGVTNVGGGYTDSSVKSTYHVNQHFHVGGTLEVNSNDWDLGNATVEAKRLKGSVGNLSLNSTLNKTSSHSSSASGSTSGNFSVQDKNSETGTLGTPTSIHTTEATDLQVHHLNLGDGQILSDGNNHVVADDTTTKSSHEYRRGNSFGLSGNVHDVENNKDAKTAQTIPTWNVAVSHQDYQATQQATINGNDFHSNTQTGDPVNTSNGDGHHITRNNNFDVQARVPIPNKENLKHFEDNVTWASSQIAGLAQANGSSAHTNFIPAKVTSRRNKRDAGYPSSNRTMPKHHSTPVKPAANDSAHSSEIPHHRVKANLAVPTIDLSLKVSDFDSSKINQYAHEYEVENKTGSSGNKTKAYYSNLSDDDMTERFVSTTFAKTSRLKQLAANDDVSKLLSSSKYSTGFIFDTLNANPDINLNDGANIAYDSRLKSRMFRSLSPENLLKKNVNYLNSALWNGSHDGEPLSLEDMIRPNRTLSLLDPYVVQNYQDKLMVQQTLKLTLNNQSEDIDFKSETLQQALVSGWKETTFDRVKDFADGLLEEIGIDIAELSDTVTIYSKILDSDVRYKTVVDKLYSEANLLSRKYRKISVYATSAGIVSPILVAGLGIFGVAETKPGHKLDQASIEDAQIIGGYLGTEFTLLAASNALSKLGFASKTPQGIVAGFVLALIGGGFGSTYLACETENFNAIVFDDNNDPDDKRPSHCLFSK